MEAIGIFTRTESREITEDLGSKMYSLGMSNLAYDVLKEYLKEDVLKEEGRWFDVEIDEREMLYATTGKEDLEFYIMVE